MTMATLALPSGGQRTASAPISDPGTAGPQPLSPDPRPSCPFCDLRGRYLVAENDLAVAFRDGFPVNPGHTLIIPRRHVPTWFEATKEEQFAILELADRVRADLAAELRPDGYNLGLNVGEAAGQTVPHLHLHVIPRFKGDVDDPAGGVRFVIPARGNYRNPGFIPNTGSTGSSPSPSACCASSTEPV
jgi:diadenosine tetraphosphate (Ap4A) HIT family hydrolase